MESITLPRQLVAVLSLVFFEALSSTQSGFRTIIMFNGCMKADLQDFADSILKMCL